MINQPIPTETEEFDPFQSAMNATEKTFDLFGKVDALMYACGLKKDLPPFDPSVHDRRYTAVKMYIQPLDEIEVKYAWSWECTWVAEHTTWIKITKPSILALIPDLETLTQLNSKWARIARVDSLEKPYPKKDTQGNPTDEMVTKKTFKFVAIYNTEDECRAAYLANGGTLSNGHIAASVSTPDDAGRATAHEFLRVSIVNVVKAGKTTVDEIKAEITGIAAHPIVAKHFTIDSPETLALIEEALKQ